MNRNKKLLYLVFLILWVVSIIIYIPVTKSALAQSQSIILSPELIVTGLAAGYLILLFCVPIMLGLAYYQSVADEKTREVNKQ